MARKFKARKLSESRLKQRASDSGSMFDALVKNDYPVFSPSEGAHRLRLLPGTFDDDAYWGYLVYIHYGVGPDQGQYLCLDRMGAAEPCPICSERHSAGLDEETERQLRPTKRVAAWVVDRATEKEGPKIWLMPQTVDKDIADRCIDKMTNEVIDIVDPEDGFDIEFTREGSSINTKYIGINIARRPSPVSTDPDTMEKWLDFIEENPLSQCLNYYSSEHIARVFRGVPSGGTDTTPRRAAGKAEEGVDDDIPVHHPALAANGDVAAQSDGSDDAGSGEHSGASEPTGDADATERDQRYQALQERLRRRRAGHT